MRPLHPIHNKNKDKLFIFISPIVTDDLAIQLKKYSQCTPGSALTPTGAEDPQDQAAIPHRRVLALEDNAGYT
jgi:hypothetical protein